MDLITSNIKKYTSFKEELSNAGINLIKFDDEIPEIQATTLKEVAKEKAKAAAQIYGEPCLVDDSGLFLEAYSNFPGPYTKFIINSIGSKGLIRLLENESSKANLVCYISCWVGGEVFISRGEIAGILNPKKKVEKNSPGPLSSWFIPNGEYEHGVLQHRANALEKLINNISNIRNKLNSN